MKPVNAISEYLKGVLVEMKKVVWPTFSQLMKYLLSVIFGVILATAFVGGVDYVFINYLLPLFIK